MKVKIIIIAYIAFLIALYCAISFATWKANPANWGEGRVLYSIAFTMLTVICGAGVIDKINSDKK